MKLYKIRLSKKFEKCNIIAAKDFCINLSYDDCLNFINSNNGFFKEMTVYRNWDFQIFVKIIND